MRLSMRDWRVLVLVIGTLVFARLSGGRLPYFIFYLSGTTVLVSWLWTRHAVRRTDCLIQVEDDTTEVGKSLGVKVRLDNDTFLPMPWVEVDDATPQHLVVTDMPIQATSVPLWGSRVVSFRLTARRRGHYTVGPIRITLGDAFGLFQGRREFHSRATVTVYPRTHLIEGLPVPLSQPFGPVRTRERAFEDPSNQSEIRPYQPGDNPRHIHWKTTARLGEFMIREYELNATTQLMLFPDMYSSAQRGDLVRDGRSTVETTVEVAASLASLGLSRKLSVGLVCHAAERYTVSTGRGRRTFQEILEVLARVEGEGGLPIEQVLEAEAAHLPGKATLVVMTPRLTPQLADGLIRLRSNHQVMLVLLRPETYAAEPAPATTAGNGKAGGGEAEAAIAAETLTAPYMPLAALLTMRRVAVYLVSAEDDLRRLADLKLTTGSEGVKAWSQGGRLSGIR